MAPRRIADTLQRLRSEYLDMPRLSLTPGQVAQILNVDPPTARGLLHTLEESHFLERTRDGRFARTVPRPELHDCALCRQPRTHGSLLRVEDTDEAEAIWVCADCQHKLTCGIDDEGVQGG